jgi:pSer/pThr/pTyr-binding forkhead associated (FHA) protein
MIQISILSGKLAGAVVAARRFPFSVGRNNDASLRLEEDGVWDRHLELDLEMPDGFRLRTNPGALTAVNGQPTEQTILRNGDVIEIGPVKIQFWLSRTRQADLRLREFLTWFALATLCAAQVAVVYWLIR